MSPAVLRRRPTRLAAVAGLTAALALGASSCSNGSGPSLSSAGGTSPSVATTSTDPLADIAPAGTPAVGTCRPVLSEAERTASYEPDRIVPCDREHGAEVVASVEVPAATAALVTADAIRTNDPTVQQALADTAGSCSRPVQEAVDDITELDLEGTPFFQARQRSVLRGVWFLPSPERWEDGERWLVCEVAAVDAARGSVALTGPLAELGRGTPLPADLGGCVDDRLREVPCADEASRVVATGRIQGDEPPADDVALDGCATLAERLGLDLGGRALRTRASLVAEGTYEVFCLAPGPKPVPVT